MLTTPTELWGGKNLNSRERAPSHPPVDASFSWLVELQTICREIYSTFNWGKNYENFLQVCADLDIEMKKLTNFQRTRFANSVRFVFINLRADYSAVRQSLVNLIAAKENSSVAKVRGKAEEAKCILRKINSWGFLFKPFRLC